MDTTNQPPLLERLFTESAGDLTRYFARRHGGAEGVQDLVQETFLEMARGLRVNKVNDVALNRYRSLENDAVVDLLARNLRPRGLTSGFGGAIALTDGTIHHQDIRRALDLPRTIPEAPPPAMTPLSPPVVRPPDAAPAPPAAPVPGRG